MVFGLPGVSEWLSADTGGACTSAGFRWESRGRREVGDNDGAFSLEVI